MNNYSVVQCRYVLLCTQILGHGLDLEVHFSLQIYHYSLIIVPPNFAKNGSFFDALQLRHRMPRGKTGFFDFLFSIEIINLLNVRTH